MAAVLDAQKPKLCETCPYRIREQRPLSTVELAQHVGCSAKFLRDEIASGHLKAIRLGRGASVGSRFVIAFDEARRYCLQLGVPMPQVKGGLPESIALLWKALLASIEPAILGKNDICIDANDAVVRLMGYPRHELIGQKPSLMIHPRDLPLIKRITQTNTHAARILLRHHAGHEIPVLMTRIRIALTDVTYTVAMITAAA